MSKEPAGFIYFKISRLIRKSFAEELKSQFGDEISTVEGRALSFICHNPGVSPKEMGEAFGFTKSTVSELVASLVNKGFVEALVKEDDRRGKHLFLTKKGEEIDAKVYAVLEAHDGKLFSDLTEEEWKTVNKIYEKIENRAKGENQ